MTATEKLNMFDAALAAYIHGAPTTITVTKSAHGYTNSIDDTVAATLTEALLHIDENYKFDSIIFN
jgi:hypothetical protein